MFVRTQMQFCFSFALVDGIVNVSMLIGSFCGSNLNSIHRNFIWKLFVLQCFFKVIILLTFCSGFVLYSL